ncbi:hypothetical protein ACFLS1_08440 [Verrucomicrobiota bacterium]
MNKLIIFLLFILIFLPIIQAETVVSTQKLDETITEVISHPEYDWRFPREKPELTDKEPSLLAQFFQKLGDWIVKGLKKIWDLIEKGLRWLDKYISPKSPQRDHSGGINWHSPIRLMLFISLAIIASILGILLFRMWKNRGKSKKITPHTVISKPNIMSEETVASQLPWDEWMKMALEFMEKGELRFAIRAMFLSCLAYLAYHEKITIAKHKSNREYMQELQRRTHDQPVVLTAFAGNVRILESAWYGMHKVTEDMFAVFKGNQDKIIPKDIETQE